MNATALPSLSLLSTALSRFSQFMGMAREMIGKRLNPPLLLRDASRPPLNPTIAEIAWRRLRRAETLFLALAARFRAGALRPCKPELAPRRAPSAKRPTPGPDAAAKTRIPRRFGWLLNQVPNQIVAPAHYLRLLLAEPAMRELLAASPRAGRILASSCHMLGIEPELLKPRPNPAVPTLIPDNQPPPPPAPPPLPPPPPLRPWIPALE